MSESIKVEIELNEKAINQIAQRTADILSESANKKSDSKKEEEKYYTVEEVAAIVKSEPNTIRDHIRRGLLIANKPGKSWLVSETNLKKYTNG